MDSFEIAERANEHAGLEDFERVCKENDDLKARLDRVTELVAEWIPPLEHLQRSIDDGTYGTTNVPGACAKALKQALKEGVK